MSKKSERELRERKEQEFLERESRIRKHVFDWLIKFDNYYPQRAEPLNEVSIEMYINGLRNLTPLQIDRGCEEAMKVCKFPPLVAEITAALKEWTDAQPMPGTAVSYDVPKENAADRAMWSGLMADFWKEHKTKDSEPMPGMRWNWELDKQDEAKFGRRRENGWRPREESWRAEIEQNARIKPQKPWHAPIVIREPGVD